MIENNLELTDEERERASFPSILINAHKEINHCDILKEIKNSKMQVSYRSEYQNIYEEILLDQEEVLCSPLRFTGVSIEKIKQIFASYGVDTESKF